MADQIIVYGTETCPYCKQARAAYGEKALFIDVNADPGKLSEMLSLSGGKRQVPVIVDGDRVTVGFLGDKTLRGAVPIFGGT